MSISLGANLPPLGQEPGHQTCSWRTTFSWEASPVPRINTLNFFFFSKLWLCCLQLDEMLLGLFEHLSKTHQLLCFNATAYRNSLPKNESKFKNFLVCGTQQEIFWIMYWLFSRVSKLNLRNGSVWVNWVKCLTEKYDSRIIWFEFATSVNSHECVKSVKCENEKLFQC